MDKRLLDKKVIVTGGSRGIGAGIVERLFNEGAEIIIADIKKDLANKLIENLDTNKITFFETIKDATNFQDEDNVLDNNSNKDNQDEEEK